MAGTRTLGLSLTLALLISFPLSAQLGILGFDPDLEWQTLATEHFRIHFHQGLAGVAREVAGIAEEAYETLMAEFGQAPPTVDLVLVDPFDFSNGFANPFSDQIVIFTSQYRLSDWANVRLDSWWEMVVFHELVHAVDLDQTRAISNLLRKVFGKIALPNMMKPVPFIEGLAVYEKYKHLGEARLNDSRTRMVIRQMVLDNRIPRFDEIEGAYSRSEWPPVGTLWYNYGSWFMRYIEETYGDEALAKFNAVNAKQPLNLLWFTGFGANLDWVTKEALGVSADELYADFKTWLRGQFRDEIARIRSQGLTQALRITTHGFWTDGAAWSPTGEWIAYTHSGPGRSGLRLITPPGEDDHELVAGGTLAAPAWSPEGTALIYAKLDYSSPYAVRSDLYRYDLEDEREERLTWGERAYFARVAPDGSTVYYARNVGHDGSTALAALDLETGETRIVRDFSEMGGVIHSFAVSPQGDRIALALWRPGGYQDLYLMPAEGGELVPVTQDENELADPAWSPDGKYVLFNADPDRVDNLYAYRIEDGKFFKITNALTGAFGPTVSPQGEFIAFLGYSSAGYDLYRLAYEPQNWKPVEFPQTSIPEWTGYPAESEYPLSPYNPLPSLQPRFWLPVPLSDGLGIVTAGIDPLFRHTYSVLAGWDWARGQPIYELFYSNNEIFPVTLTAAAGRWGSHLGLDVTLPLSLSLDRGQQLTVGYERALKIPEQRAEEGRANDNDGETQGPRMTHTLSGTYRFSHTRQEDLFRDETGVTVSGELINVEQTGAWHKKLVLEWHELLRLPLLETHRLDLRATAGWTDSPHEDEQFALGGPYDRFVLRGFESGALQGQQALSAGLQYDFPLFAIERGWGGWPVLFDDLGGSVFLDAGMAGDELSLSELKLGFGAQLRLSVTLGYAMSVELIGGAAQGLGEARPRFYLNVGLPELF